MAKVTKYVLSIAGFDPSGGAGILADIKTFEVHNVIGMGALSAHTIQNDCSFDSLSWIETDEILKQIAILQNRFEFSVIKIGLIKDLEVLQVIINYLIKTQPQSCIIWDPIIQASAGYQFHDMFESNTLFSILKNCFLITPNTNEVKFLAGIENPIAAARELSKLCNVLLKGGHNQEEPGVDYLFNEGKIEKIMPFHIEVFPKHGSGCVLSSAIASNLALGNDLITSCRNAKRYVEQFLLSNQTLLGTHGLH